MIRLVLILERKFTSQPRVVFFRVTKQSGIFNLRVEIIGRLLRECKQIVKNGLDLELSKSLYVLVKRSWKKIDFFIV